MARVLLLGFEKLNPTLGTPDERESLAREHAVLGRLVDRAMYDVWAGVGENPAEDARGVMLKEEVEIDGETYLVDKPNPTIDREGRIRARRRKIREELRYYENIRPE